KTREDMRRRRGLLPRAGRFAHRLRPGRITRSLEPGWIETDLCRKSAAGGQEDVQARGRPPRLSSEQNIESGTGSIAGERGLFSREASQSRDRDDDLGRFRQV